MVQGLRASLRRELVGMIAAGQLIACADSPLATAATAVKPGMWGGEHLALEVTQTGARLQFDCAHAVIAQQLMADAQGTVVAQATFVREGGPTREQEQGEAARYEARIDGDTMTLTITLVDSGEKIGPFSVAFGRQPVLRRCQ